MAEGVFKAWEKYPYSLRLDHPDFGDVHKTVYAKGIIKEFAKISDDPLKAKSMVTVDIAAKGLSDFIPLFYHPKPEYWNNQDGTTTVFNQEGKYFEKAWMSFRTEDEVQVMLREGKPYAVLGFADGVPRVGEDVFQLKWEGADATWEFEPAYQRPLSRQLQLSRAIKEAGLGGTPDCAYSDYNEEKKGPDGLELGLNKIIDSPIAIAPYLNNPVWHQYFFWFFNIGPYAVIFTLLGGRFPEGPLNEPSNNWGATSPSSGSFFVKFYEEGLEDKVAAFLNSQGFGDDIDEKLIDFGFRKTYMNPDFNGETEFLAFRNWFDPETIEIHIRPHTKTELQEAGMWPKA